MVVTHNTALAETVPLQLDGVQADQLDSDAHCLRLWKGRNCLFFFFKVQLIYVLVSVVQQSDSVIYVCVYTYKHVCVCIYVCEYVCVCIYICCLVSKLCLTLVTPWTIGSFVHGISQTRILEWVAIYIHIFFFRFFSIIGYYKILHIVLCYTKGLYLFHIQQCVPVNPQLLIYSSLMVKRFLMMWLPQQFCVKNLSANAGDTGLTPELGRSRAE